MKLMLMHKMTDELEKGLPPDPEILRGIGFGELTRVDEVDTRQIAE